MDWLLPLSSVVDPDPYVFGPPGSGSGCQRYGSGSFYHQAKIVRKTLIPTVLRLLFRYRTETSVVDPHCFQCGSATMGHCGSGSSFGIKSFDDHFFSIFMDHSSPPGSIHTLSKTNADPCGSNPDPDPRHGRK
jgi:hypothetical protein